MTYLDYTLLCIGDKDKKLEEQRSQRQSQWITICGYKDPKKPPHTMEQWWPIEGDRVKIFVKPDHSEIIQFHNEFKSLKKNVST